MIALRIGIGEVEAVVERESGHGQPDWLLELRPANRLPLPGMRPQLGVLPACYAVRNRIWI